MKLLFHNPNFFQISRIMNLLFVPITFVHSQDEDDDEEVEDDFLAEILAEEEREAAEMTRLEEEMRELEELKAQHQQMHQNQQANKMKPGKKKNSIPGTGTQNLGDIEEELRKKEAEKAEAKRGEQHDEIDAAQKKKADEIALQREIKYQAELEKLHDDKARKALTRQKRRDGQIVKRVLRNSENDRHYAVLGLKCKWGEISFGPFSFCSVSPSEVKRAYRNIARSVHPDKNRDGRAGEAFDALEKSAALLTDPSKKKDYDAKLRRQRKATLKQSLVMLENAWKTLRTIFKLLGPFATPIAILLALII